MVLRSPFGGRHVLRVMQEPVPVDGPGGPCDLAHERVPIIVAGNISDRLLVEHHESRHAGIPGLPATLSYGNGPSARRVPRTVNLTATLAHFNAS